MQFDRKLTVTDSSQIAKLQYSTEEKKLVVQFMRGGSYLYEGITPAMFGRLAAAESVGSYFANNIKPKYEGKKL